MAQVGILHRSQAHDSRDLRLLLGAHLAPALILGVDHRRGARDGLVQEVLQLHRAPLTRLEGASVGAENHSKADVVELHVVGHPADGARRREEHLEVLSLADIGDVDHPLGLLFLDAVAQRREVSGLVVVSPVRLPDDERQRATLPVGEPGEEDAHGAFGLHRQTALLELGHHLWQHRVVEALAAIHQPDAKALINLVGMAQRLGAEDLPQPAGESDTPRPSGIRGRREEVQRIEARIPRVARGGHPLEGRGIGLQLQPQPQRIDARTRAA